MILGRVVGGRCCVVFGWVGIMWFLFCVLVGFVLFCVVGVFVGEWDLGVG